ncbi:MAG: hypothetical protein ACOYJ6_19855, partial [Caulobacterales bacterium]
MTLTGLPEPGAAAHVLAHQSNPAGDQPIMRPDMMPGEVADACVWGGCGGRLRDQCARRSARDKIAHTGRRRQRSGQAGRADHEHGRGKAAAHGAGSDGAGQSFGGIGTSGRRTAQVIALVGRKGGSDGVDPACSLVEALAQDWRALLSAAKAGVGSQSSMIWRHSRLGRRMPAAMEERWTVHHRPRRII